MQLPTSFISKQLFTASIEALRQQFVEDKKNAEVMALMFRAEDFGKYDNSLLSNAILELLRMSFPKDEDGHCEIEHYCYCTNFGKVGDEFESAEELYDRLCFENGRQSPYLFDEMGVFPWQRPYGYGKPLIKDSYKTTGGEIITYKKEDLNLE